MDALVAPGGDFIGFAGAAAISPAGTDLFWNPDNTYYLGYDSVGAACGRPIAGLFTQRVSVGFTNANNNPMYALRHDDGAACLTGTENSFLQGHFNQNSLGITTPVELRAGEADSPLLLSSMMADGAGNVSCHVLADVNVAAINARHEILRLSWRNNADVNQTAFQFFQDEMAITSANTAQVVGTEADGANAVGVQVGANNDFTTAGARLVEWVNNVVSGTPDVRGYLDLNGTLAFNGLDNGQLRAEATLPELTTIAAAAFTDTTIQIPADAQVIAVSVRVVVTIPTAATFDVGVAGATTRYGTGLNVAAGTTNPGTDDGVRFYAAAIAIRITPNIAPANNSGRVRVTIHYRQITPPTS